MLLSMPLKPEALGPHAGLVRVSLSPLRGIRGTAAPRERRPRLTRPRFGLTLAREKRLDPTKPGAIQRPG